MGRWKIILIEETTAFRGERTVTVTNFQNIRGWGSNTGLHGHNPATCSR